MDVTVEAIGAQGDGIANSPEGRLYIPFAAPGDRLRVEAGEPRGDGHAARIAEIIEPGVGRIKPVCRHFGDCGGCSFQHIAPDGIAEIKRNILTTALARRRLVSLLVDNTISVPPGTRRRVRLAFKRGMRGILGFNRRESRMVLNVMECPVVVPEIATLLAPLRELCHSLTALGKGADIQITLLDSGIDMLFLPEKASDPDLEARESLAAFAEAHDLCRLSWHNRHEHEPIAIRRTPSIRFGKVSVQPPPDAFLQPSAAGERAVVTAVLAGLAEAAPTRIADLYAGCGALTFPLAANASVQAIDGNGEMVSALRSAANGANVIVDKRDLWRNPMAPDELSIFDAVVFDPPRAGAKPLAEALARSSVPTVIAVSCNPSTLGRDLRILVDGGYTVERVTPIDQFPWSAHVEAVAVLRR